MSLLDGQTAVVTGGSSGIGRGIARQFAEYGAGAVVVADVREQPKEEGAPTHELLESETATAATYVDCDVSETADLEAAIDAADEFGGVDVMVNNAGIWHPEDFFETTEAQFQRLLDINLKGAYFGSQVAARRMADEDGGSIINISSIAGLFGNGNWPTYAASKGGLTMLTYSLAHRLADHGIRVNAIHPGGIETLIGSDGDASDRQADDPGGDPQGAETDQAAAFAEVVPLGRYGQPEEVGDAAVYLASDLASYVTGESLVVDGGWTSWR